MKIHKKQFEKLDKLENLKLDDNLTRFNLFSGIPTYNQALTKRDEAKKLEATLIRKHDTVKNGWNLRYED